MDSEQTATTALRRSIAPYSRPLRKGIVNGRSREGRYVAAYEAELVRHMGGTVSVVARRLIERSCMLALHLLLFDEKALKQGGLAPRDSREYLALHGALTKTLVKLGLKGAADEPATPSLAQILREHAAAKPAAIEEEPEDGPAVPARTPYSGAEAAPAIEMPPDAEMGIPGTSGGLGDGEKAEP